MSVIEHLHKSFVCHFFAPIICEKPWYEFARFAQCTKLFNKSGTNSENKIFGADSRLKTTSLSNYECKCRAVMFVVLQPKVDY